MKRESFVRATLATAVAVLVLLCNDPLYARAKKEPKKIVEPRAAIARLILWVNSRLVPPWPEPGDGSTTETESPGSTTDPTSGTEPVSTTT